MSIEERRMCPVCSKEVVVELIRKPDVDLKLCRTCGGVIAILYRVVITLDLFGDIFLIMFCRNNRLGDLRL